MREKEDWIILSPRFLTQLPQLLLKLFLKSQANKEHNKFTTKCTQKIINKRYKSSKISKKKEEKYRMNNNYKKIQWFTYYRSNKSFVESI